MRLLELCLLPLLSPQQPAPTPVVPPPTPTAESTGESPADAPASTDDDRQALAAQERAGDKADPAELARLANSQDAAIAARAAWQLGRGKGPAVMEALQTVATKSPHADARVQAMQALVKANDVGSTTAAIQALDDGDRRVRTLAAQALGRLRRPTAKEPLMGLLDRTRERCEPGPATDVQAALLALHDLGATDLLLRAATAVHDGKAEGAGTALAYLCQSLSPQLERAQEVTFLLAVIGHREPLVRRYAIGRVAELDEPSAVAALEGRLAQEGDELRPLVEVALAQVRKDKVALPEDELARATQNLHALVAMGKAKWATMTQTEQGLTAGAPVVLLLLVWMLRRRSRRARAAAEAAATLAMVQPSDEFVEQTAAEAEELAAAAETEAGGTAPVSWHKHAPARR